MPATINGTVITQTGSDTSLDFLAGFSNVSVFWIAGVECYYVEGSLDIEGSVTFDTFAQHLSVYSAASTNAINVKSGGSLTLSNYILDKPSYLPAIQAKVLSTSTLHSAIRVSGGGTLDCRGVKIIGEGDAAFPIVFELGSTIYLEDAWIVSNKFIRVANQGSGVPSITIKNVISQTGSLAVLYAPEVFEGLTIYTGNLTFATGASDYTIRNFKAIGVDTVLNNWNNLLLRIKNPADGTTNRCFTGEDAPVNTKFNVVSRETQFKFTDVDGNPTGGYCWIGDNDNGNRFDVPYLPGDQSQQLIYTADSDPITGLTPVLDVILYIGRNPVSGQIAIDDYRTNIPERGSDLLNIFGGGWGYNLFSIPNQDFKGTNALVLSQTLTPDFAITYATIDEVRALPLIASQFDFYDSVAAWVQDNRNGQTEYMVTRTGDLIDARGYELVIDATAANNIAFDGTTITAKANAVSYKLTTTSDITAGVGVSVDGATLNAANYYITDAPATLTLDGGVYHITSDIDVSDWTLLNGASFIVDADNVTITARGVDPLLFNVNGHVGVVLITGLLSTIQERSGFLFSAYASDNDRRLEQNVLALNVTSYTFEYDERLSDTYYLWVTVGGLQIPYDVAIVEGLNEFDLGTTGQLLSLSDKIDIVNRGVQKSSLSIPHTEDT